MDLKAEKKGQVYRLYLFKKLLRELVSVLKKLQDNPRDIAEEVNNLRNKLLT